MNHKNIKLKRETDNLCKLIKPPDFFDEILNIVKEFLPNDNPNKKIYRIKSVESDKILKSQEDYENFRLENLYSLIVSLIDKPPIFQSEKSHIFIQSNILFPNKKELSEEEKIKEGIRTLVQSKLQSLEKTILDSISKKYPQQNNINNNNAIIHKGIKCSNCGMKNIIGIRYKCTTCSNYNLCEECEDSIEHDDTHVFLKIKEPVESENNLDRRINNSLIILSQDFMTEPNEFNFAKTNLINIQVVLLTNSTNNIWKKNSRFICIKEKSNLIGNDCIIEENIKPGKSVSLELVYEDMKDINDKKEFISCYKLVDENDKQIGNIHNFKIHMS